MPIDYSKLQKQYKAKVQDKERAAAAAMRPMGQAPSGDGATLPQAQERSVFGKAADAVDAGYERYKNTLPIRGLRAAVGGAVGAAGTAIGASVGVALTPLERFVSTARDIKNEGLVGGLIKSAKDTPSAVAKNVGLTAKSTGGFGYKVGDEGAAQAPLAAAGKLVNAAQAYSQAYHGVEDIQEGRYVEGGLKLGAAALSGRQAIKAKGMLVDSNFMKTPSEIAGEKLDKAKQEAADVYSEVLNLGKRQAKNQQTAALQGRAAKDIPKLLAQEDIKIGTTPDGKLDTTPGVMEIQRRLQAVDESMAEGLKKDPTKWFDLDQMGADVKKEISSMPGRTALQKKAMMSQVDDIISAEKEAAGAVDGPLMVDGSEVANLKRGLYSMADYDATKTPDSQLAIKMMAKNAKEAIEKHYPDANIRNVNEIIGSYAEMIKALRSVHGQVVRGSMLGKRLNQVIGAVAGGSMGPVGSLIGAEAAGKLTDIVLDPMRRTSAASASLRRLGVKTMQQQADDIMRQSSFGVFGGPQAPKAIDPIPVDELDLVNGTKTSSVRPGDVYDPGQDMYFNVPKADAPAGGADMGKLAKGGTQAAMGGLAGIEPVVDENGKFTGQFRYNAEKGALGMLVMGGIAATRGRSGKFVKTVKPEEAATLVEFIDYVRDGTHKLKPNLGLETQAGTLAETLGIRQPKTINGLANNIVKFLEENIPHDKTLGEFVAAK